MMSNVLVGKQGCISIVFYIIIYIGDSSGCLEAKLLEKPFIFARLVSFFEFRSNLQF